MYLLILSSISLISFVFLYYLSVKFLDTLNILKSPIIEFVFIYILVCFSYFLIITRYIKQAISIKNLTILIFIVGIVFRLLMIFSAPILEVDFYRYLWDGGVLANGHNPYKYAPDVFDVFKEESSSNDIPEDLILLGKQNSNILNSINHPQLKTSYPPVAELSFALAHIIKPYSLISWKFVLLFFDIITFILICLVLKKLKLPESNIIIYWLNPLLIKETFNSAHMDVIVFPFVLAGLLLFLRRNYIFSFSSLALAIGTKLWPIILIPCLLRRFFSDKTKIVTCLLIFATISLVILLPLINSFFEQSSGIEAYVRSWQNNDSIFRILLGFSELVLPLAGYHPGYGQFTSRVLVVILSILAIIFISRTRPADDVDIIRRSLIIVSSVFFLSPAQFPWYYLWMLPFLTVIPYKPLLLLTVLMPLYYMRYYFEPRGKLEFYNQYVVWSEYLPVLAWILYDFMKNNRLVYLKSRSFVS